MIKKPDKPTINLCVDSFIFFPFVLLALSGLIIQINYHAGDLLDTANVLWLDRRGWLFFHKITAVISVSGIAVHVFLHTGWIKMVLRKKIHSSANKNVNTNILLFSAFIFTSTTGFTPWLLLSAIDHTHFVMIEIHDKIGIILIVLFLVHFFKHLRWINKKFQIFVIDVLFKKSL